MRKVLQDRRAKGVGVPLWTLILKSAMKVRVEEKGLKTER
ncbi:uncharacterized protein G2W53_013880 [Senna tora]|uniref:Uncharacterized protein n=1 Tax=Senna tora TaxID=362788 RepID=A0A834WR29_9FABA|nr:uncharacterized protein G2W53_013880 [Senna tora]